ncbi:MAG: Maf family protein [Patescibacteria group bacterium]|nr:septum formation protein Maf [Patescibacteria group bacterium]
MQIKLSKPLILASGSPRRFTLLKELGLDFEVDPAIDFQEKENAEDLTPEAIAIHNAEGKALEVAKNHPKSLILGVDTIGAYQHHILGKPKDLEDARRILKILNGTTHEVISGICLIDTEKNRKIARAEKTLVTFAKMSPREIETYLESGESMDKAAAFAIQGLGSLFIEKIDGDYFNVVGLPIFRMYKMFKEFGENLI